MPAIIAGAPRGRPRADLRLMVYVPADEATTEAVGRFAGLEPRPIG
jgi:hypothetical protein